MKITQTSNSRLATIDFLNLPFGQVFSDHMLVCTYKDGNWSEAEIKPYGPVLMPPGAQVLHYGQSVFEGMKAFKNDADEILLFREQENFKRLNKSAKRLSIPEIPEDIFIDGLHKLLSLDSEWCKKEDEYSLYVRPFIFASGECIKATASEEYTFMIITSPTTTYYAKDVHVVIEEHYTRASRGGAGFAKAAGNYAASFLPTKKANAKGFTQLIWTDAKEHKYIEESGTMNIWFRINDSLITPELSDSILAGITRDSIITLARDKGIVVEERKILISEIVDAFNKGTLKEIFGTGTAVTVNTIKSITHGQNRMEISKQDDSFALTLKTALQDIQKGRVADCYNWTSKITTSIPSI